MLYGESRPSLPTVLGGRCWALGRMVQGQVLFQALQTLQTTGVLASVP